MSTALRFMRSSGAGLKQDDATRVTAYTQRERLRGKRCGKRDWELYSTLLRGRPEGLSSATKAIGKASLGGIGLFKGD